MYTAYKGSLFPLMREGLGLDYCVEERKGKIFWADFHILVYTHCCGLMELVGSHSSSALLFVMKVMV
jgi:hypothetical protein